MDEPVPGLPPAAAPVPAPPARRAPSPQTRQPGRPSGAVRSEGGAHARVGEGASAARRVVVAEDEALIRLDLVEMLREEGYDVVAEAGDGASAVRLADEHRPDVVIMDVKMPVLDGLSAAEQVVSRRLAAVVVLTAFSQRDLVERAREAGVMAYLVKPFQKGDLVPAIELAVARFQEAVALEREVADLSGRLEARKAIERAKGLLQAGHGMSEPAAFRWIQRTSMDERTSMREVAQQLLDGARVPSDPGGPDAPDPAPEERGRAGGSSQVR